MPQLTEYELERQANIERNQAILQSLGIFQADVGPSKAKKASLLLDHLSAHPHMPRPGSRRARRSSSRTETTTTSSKQG